MRISHKPAAVSAAAGFLLLLLLDLTWPGHGIWLIVVGVLSAAAAAAIWWREYSLSSQQADLERHASPFTAASAYGLAGASFRAANRQPTGVSLSLVLAPISAVAILLFVGGALGNEGGDDVSAATILEQDVDAIDRSGDNMLETPEVQPTSSRDLQPATNTATVSRPQNSTASSAPATESEQTTSSVRPIVVSAPSVATLGDESDEDPDLAPEAAATFEYVVADGDTIYDIAERYNSTVDTIMNLNRLDANSFIHPGDVLLVPIDNDQSESEETETDAEEDES